MRKAMSRKGFAFVLIFAVMCAGFGITASAKAVQKASFERVELKAYDDSKSEWFIDESAKKQEDTPTLGANVGAYALASNTVYATAKVYELQSDCDFTFSGTYRLQIPSWVTGSTDGANVDFFVCTDDGTVIWPDDNTGFKNITPKGSDEVINGGKTGMKKGEKIWFVMRSNCGFRSPYLSMPLSVFETPYGVEPELSTSDTQAGFSGVQGEFGWYYYAVKKDTISFAGAEIEDAVSNPNPVSSEESASSDSSSGDSLESAEEEKPNTAGDSNDKKGQTAGGGIVLIITIAVAGLIFLGQSFYMFTTINKKDAEIKRLKILAGELPEEAEALPENETPKEDENTSADQSDDQKE